eukprot:Nitzschia sp. Nitz4//scaffold273_size25297//5642//6469//NITZ4_008314-RA/size25297-processed-gene-0.3-mRNA-1//-1//CDS//3329545241//4447//frame0
MILNVRAFLIASSALVLASAWEESCTQFKNIYADGTELCEVMWGGAFEVVDDESQAYTMWFFDSDNNPNDEITRTLFGDSTVPDECHLQYFHKETPGPEDEMTECHPWKNNACCDSTTVQSVEQLNDAYGDGYHWDRCGPMSQACERFFVMEACLYECEPSAGLFRKYNDSQTEHPDYNEWELHKMPIKKSFCNAWYDACANDYFCGTGDFFECAAYYEDNHSESLAKEIDTGLVVGLSIAAVVAAIGVCFAAFLVRREKQGKPVFASNDEAVQS